MEREFTELCKYNIRDYSSAVNEARAIPDAATGLKPIHRKILYEMWADKITSKGKFKKCAYMVGQLISRFSPHGDTATYDALVRLSQPWVQRYPLLDFHGNNGSAIGDSQAAMRYTESKLSPLAEKGFLETLDKSPVDWEMNFSNEEKEPSSLPAVFPGLFCLPNQGMGYACSCNFLTYNLDEISRYLVSYIEGNASECVPCYDLPTGGTLVTPEAMETIAKTGKGTVVFEAAYEINGRNIIFSEFPFGVMLDKVYEEISSLYEKDLLPNVSDFRNDSENGKLKLLVECKSEKAVPQTLEYLLEKTSLRSSYAINQVALVGKTPKLLTLADMCRIYVSHNLSCIKREHEYDLAKTLDRIEILEGLAKALGDIDGLIRLIKNSESAAKAREKLLSYDFTARQADAILAMKLSRLAHLEVDSVLQELKEKRELADSLRSVIDSECEQKKILCERLQRLAKEFGDSRRTQVIQKKIVKPSNVKKKDEPQDVVFCLDENAYAKAVPLGKFHTNESNVREDKTRTDKLVILYSNKGRAYRLKVDAIKPCLNSEKGTAIGPLLELAPDEKIVDFSVNATCPALIMVTKSGRVKVMGAKHIDGTTQNKRGIPMMKLDEEDEIVYCSCIDDKSFVEIRSSGLESRKAIFQISDITLTGKSSSGRIGIKLKDGEHVSYVRLLEDVDKRRISRLGTRGAKV